jgi:hypothetical protein
MAVPQYYCVERQRLPGTECMRIETRMMQNYVGGQAAGLLLCVGSGAIAAAAGC